jgi:hypothetical protein
MCYYEECREAFQARERSSGDKCEVECVHVLAAKAAQFNQSARNFTSLSYAVLSTVPFPCDVLAEFERCAKNNELNNIIHRVSDHSFVVHEELSRGSSIGVLHIRIDKKKHLYCTCSTFKRMAALCGATTAPKVSRRCSHIYLCLWAIFSNQKWKEEFALFPFDEESAPGIIISLGHFKIINFYTVAASESVESLHACTSS